MAFTEEYYFSSIYLELSGFYIKKKLIILSKILSPSGNPVVRGARCPRLIKKFLPALPQGETQTRVDRETNSEKKAYKI
jgi:hypothetical protein